MVPGRTLDSDGTNRSHFLTLHIKIVPMVPIPGELVTRHILMNFLIVVTKYLAEAV